MCRIVKLKGIYLVFSQYGWYFFNMAGIFMIWLVFTPYALGNASGLLDFSKIIGMIRVLLKTGLLV